ncbi:hypothetical protein FALBO_3583 [Fusarium albosuccineum]|uniref:Uncharacterized protein n=1 Tax=Fusarium albosuccineum TaxID=1237068 RepID=A0A8H4LJZ2_9HYPO|nr:hypothetical protein FALBO_3583 [Fusarium albosuccineum]
MDLAKQTQRIIEVVSIRVENLTNETMVETLRETRNVNQEMSKAQSAIAELRQSQLEMERNSTARYEQQELLAQAFVESIDQNLQQCLGGCESQFRVGFSGMQESLQELMWYAQPLLPQLSPNTRASMMRRSPCKPKPLVEREEDTGSGKHYVDTAKSLYH